VGAGLTTRPRATATERATATAECDPYGARVWPGIALYYAVLAFNLLVTGWIGEWLLVVVGAAVHTVAAAILWSVAQRPTAVRLGLEKQRA
jgi:hypothetical protein